MSENTTDTADVTKIDVTKIDVTRIIDTHLEAYGEADATRRAELVADVWAADGTLLDPPLEGQGHDAIAALTDIVHAHYPGHTFRRTTAVDVHHGVARYGWELVAPDGGVAVAGLDVAEFTAEGKLSRVVGFFGELQPVDAAAA